MVQTMKKPKCKLIGTDGNIFALAGKVSRTLKQTGHGDQVQEFNKRLWACQSYDEALRLIMEYVEVD